MAGLDPAIHGKRRASVLDPRIKSGGDGEAERKMLTAII
jgi:hypothetical protein